MRMYKGATLWNNEIIPHRRTKHPATGLCRDRNAHLTYVFCASHGTLQNLKDLVDLLVDIMTCTLIFLCKDLVAYAVSYQHMLQDLLLLLPVIVKVTPHSAH